MTTDRELLQQALEVAEESLGLVEYEYSDNWRHGVPTRAGQLAAIKEGLDKHRALIAALRDRLAREAAEEALGWHASACGEGSIPDVTVEALRKIEEVRK